MSSASSGKTPSKDEVKEGVWKLMDQAGRHPRLTIRMIRHQLEKKLGLNKDSLESFRPLIKKIIFHWWVDSEKEFGVDGAKQDNNTVFALQSLISLAKAAGKFPAVLKNIPDDPEKKVAELRTRLRGYGLEFSDLPTPNEINKIKRTREKQSEMDGIDQALIVDKPRRREVSEEKPSSSTSKSASESSKSSGGGGGAGDKNREKPSSSSSSSGGGETKKRRIIEDDDGEAEF
jgi:hypothetical protein